MSKEEISKEELERIEKVYEEFLDTKPSFESFKQMEGSTLKEPRCYVELKNLLDIYRIYLRIGNLRDLAEALNDSQRSYNLKFGTSHNKIYTKNNLKDTINDARNIVFHLSFFWDGLKECLKANPKEFSKHGKYYRDIMDKAFYDYLKNKEEQAKNKGKDE